jgi:hypothetical protein
MELPDNERSVRTYFLLSGTPTDSIELDKIRIKMKDYILIQNIYRVFHSESLNNGISADIIMQKIGTKPILESVPFKPTITPADIPNETKFASYLAYEYIDKEIAELKGIIKLLFINRLVWMYDDLVKAIRSGSVHGIMYNPKMYGKYEIDTALAQVTKSPFTIAQQYVKCYTT